MNRVTRIFSEGGLLEQSIDQYEIREGQIDMAEMIYSAIRHKQHLVVEAGCGVGKTLAYLVPIALQRGLRSIVSTGTRALQEQLYYKDVDIIKKYIRPGLRVVYMKGRSNYLCLYRLDHSRQHTLFDTYDYIKQYSTIEEWSKTTKEGDVVELANISEYDDVWKNVCCTADTCLYHKCPHYDACFLMNMKREANRAHLIIVNHHLYFADLMMKEKNGGKHVILPHSHVHVFDEGHMIEEIATYYLSKNFSTSLIYSASRRSKALAYEYLHRHHVLKEQLLSSHDDLEKILTEFFDILSVRLGKHHIDNYQEVWLSSLAYTDDIISALDEVINSLTSCIEIYDDFVTARDEFKYLQEQFEFITSHNDPNYVYWYNIGKTYKSIHASPIDISSLFRDGVLQHCKRVVITSATLQTNGSFEYIRRRIGLGEDVMTGIIDSPFDYPSQGLLYIPRDIPSPKKKEFITAICMRIEKLLYITSGRSLCLFTSKRNMDIVHDHISKIKDFPYQLLCQGRAGRAELLRRFSEDTHSILFATNTYWQGVDIKGEALSSVIIDKLPFAVPSDPIIYSRMKLVEQSGGNSFYEYQVPQSVMLIRQGVGRLIRTQQDHGVISILDNRVWTSRYGKLFLQSLPDFGVTSSLDDVINFI